jgi:selenocysteine-specific elongation factor
VAALTGVDTDRLPEEKARGLSIALGYAPLLLPSGRRVSLVDVPGHERFVRTMVAGATGVDAFLMAVAADDGVMPQTLEHAQVLAALGVDAGLVAVTKSDLADPLPASREAERLLPGCEAIACSAHSGAGVAELASALDRLLQRIPSRAEARVGTDAGGRVETSPVRLHIDRVFTVAGRGTVVTGTLWSGTIAVEDTLELVPRRLPIKVRGLEVHGEALACAAAGQRVAVNLRGVKAELVRPGDVLASPGVVAERSVLDCALDLEEVRKGERVQVHHGTRHAPARLRELDRGIWRMRLERPLLACAGDRLVVRRHAPARTLGGGVVLDPSPSRRSRREPSPARATAPPQAPDGVAVERVERLLRDAGMALVSEAKIDGLAGGAAAGPALRALRDRGRAVRVSGRLYAHAAAVEEARRLVVELIERAGPVTLAQARDALGVGRKAAQALLEHLDATRVTRRLQGDRRMLVG